MVENVGSDLADTEKPELAEHEESAKRRQIMEGAREVFLAQGFDAASMGEIARKAGVSKGTLYVYFDNKERLIEAIAHEECGAQAETVFSLDPADHDVEAVLTRVGCSFVKFLCRPGAMSPLRTSTGTIRREPSPQSLRADHSFRRDFHSVGSNRRSQAVPCQHPALRVQEFESDLRGGWKSEFSRCPNGAAS